MIVNIGNFGDMLLSHPTGREAFLLARAYVFNELRTGDDIILGFNEVKVLTPSWADEFIATGDGVLKKYPNKEIRVCNPIEFIDYLEEENV
jgi:hypothetical protein